MGSKRCKLSSREYAEKDHSQDGYRCKKCGRTAKKEKKLCKPRKL
jgi:tRNA(Ile2) C34 agmatinyltransferase TiaS